MLMITFLKQTGNKRHEYTITLRRYIQVNLRLIGTKSSLVLCKYKEHIIWNSFRVKIWLLEECSKFIKDLIINK